MSIGAPAPVPASPLPRGGSPAFAAVAAHQVRGPLSSVRLRLELLLDRLAPGAEADTLRQVRGALREVDRLSQVLEQVLAWGAAGQDGDVLETVDALGVAAARVDAWRVVAGERGVGLCLDGASVTARQVRGCLGQCLDVFLDNSLHVTPRGGRVTVLVRGTPGTVRVEVHDQGPGMSREEIDRACEPFWRGRAGRGHQGTGLGLPIASSLLTASGGRMELGRAHRGGLRAVAVLPRAV
ncbi:HAMP domain-containing sensor histidine kinase [Streptomyces sp. SID8352]|uniref:sensor histidine kinase n=1 Tax=Streptomyces sp. SID8352 TaxID=2690338 RepID=UPI001369BB6E|nr:HAMP domain-containing sensor histidine kinase [Streptomyces sp. SID8352]MYU24690.1 sensor histidine kinase [Streptomyces sp. SID8352]